VSESKASIAGGAHHRAPQDLRLDVHGGLDDLRAEWSRLAQATQNVFSTWEWAAVWQRHLGADSRMIIGVARDPAGAAVAIIPLYLQRTRPVRILRVIGAGPADELGPVAAPGDHAAAVAAMRRHIDGVLRRDGIFLGERLRGDRDWVGELQASPITRAASPVLRINGASFDEFLAGRSRNFRSQVRRHWRALARDHRLVVRLCAEPDRLTGDMETLIRLHDARWGAQSSAFGAQRRGFHLEFARRAMERGWLRLWIMELGGTAVAAWYGLRFAGIETYYQAGRDPRCDSLHVGTVLLAHTIRSACEDGLQEYRFGLGGESYKSRFSEDDLGLKTVAVAHGVRGKAALTAVRAAMAGPEQLRGRLRGLIGG
jgi:CelD/BcsL family acetyltransferase involved in cellulose biosynthesis